MPRLEGITTDATVERDAREAHAIRLRDRKAQYEQLLANVPKEPTKEHPQPRVERQLLQDALVDLAAQQEELDQRSPVILSKQDQEVSQLKDEVAALREALTEATAKLQVVQTGSPPDAP
mgnify:CR=1 FL=1